MEVARPTIFGKDRALSTVARNTSCSSGWLRVLVQGFFAFITVVSFILILTVAIKNPRHDVLRPTEKPRCHIHKCRVICNEAPYYGEHENHIIFAVMEANSNCIRVSLDLQNPYFFNNILPDNWLSRMCCNVNKFAIIGGNLRHISSGAFMSQFTANIKILTLQNVQIKTFESTSLVGLSSLRTLNILSSFIEDVHENALKAIDNTLVTLTITDSGNWDPINVTGFRGFEKLAIVDFSYNNFYQILNKFSFVGLKATKILYLNSCRITAIGAGTFDHLINIEILYLNNNMLSVVPPGLFTTIVALENPRPRINLQDNFWYCDCSVDDLRQLVRKDILLVEEKCTYPDEMNSITFTQFEQFCNNSTADTLSELTNVFNLSYLESARFYYDSIYVNGSYCSRSFKNDSVQLISPVRNNVCSSKMFKSFNFSKIYRDLENQGKNISKWFRFSYFLTTNFYSVVQIGVTEEQREFGLIWYQSTCPHEIYCLDVIPTFLRVYNTDPMARYTFCPMVIKNARVEIKECVDFSIMEKKPSHDEDSFHAILYIATMFVCSCFGAIVVYGLIRRKPTLLKGSKRILFVKHKSVDALVLPPKVPLRNDLTDAIGFKDKEIFTLTAGHKLKPPSVKRMKSVRSDKSGSASYISAMQPSEDQLAEWRIRHHFNNDLTIESGKSELSTLSWVDASYYNSLDDNDKTYESLK